MAIITKKKKVYSVKSGLLDYLNNHDRSVKLSIDYQSLLRYDKSINLYDNQGNDTLWETVFYPPEEMKEIYYNLKAIYAHLKADGDLSVMDHLFIDRVDLCTYGNTKPFRVRVVNKINDNFDYFYIKKADASRVYGLELEHLLSPNRIDYLVYEQTLIEEHIAGIPGEQFIKIYLKESSLNPIRLAKEFVKFNERCFLRLLGDMHSNNFVIDITPDFEEVHYRIRAIDFDQQSYEGGKSIYLPQYYKQNNAIIQMGIKYMTPETVRQYQREERSLIANRIKSSRYELKDLIDTMTRDEVAPFENIRQLREELSEHYHKRAFLDCQSMAQVLKMSLRTVFD